MKIAITGLTGFLGHYVAKRLYQTNVHVTALVRDTSNILHLSDYQSNITFQKGDLTDKECLKKFVLGADVVLHMAYERQGATFRESANKDLKRFIDANLLGSIELLDASKQEGIEQFIFISSCAVYGYIFPGIKLDEQHPLIPDSSYGAYKASIEAFCHAYFQQKNFGTTIFRPVGIYGVNPHLAHSAWYNIIKDVKHGRDVEVSDGGKIVAVEEVAHAIELAIGNKQAMGKVYNLSDFYVDNMSVAWIARDLCNSKSQITGTSKYSVNTIDNTQSKALGVRYAGSEGLRRYIQELLSLL